MKKFKCIDVGVGEKTFIQTGHVFTEEGLRNRYDSTLGNRWDGTLNDLNNRFTKGRQGHNWFMEFIEVFEETPLQQIMRERFDIVEGDEFNIKNWYNTPYTFTNNKIITKKGVELRFGDYMEILNGKVIPEKVTEPKMVEITIDGKTFEISKESAEAFKKQFADS